VALAYGYLRRYGWQPKPGLLATAGGSDDLLRCAAGLGLTAMGVARSRWLRVWRQSETRRGDERNV
jgi:hypothetical protein